MFCPKRPRKVTMEETLPEKNIKRISYGLSVKFAAVNIEKRYLEIILRRKMYILKMITI